MSSLRATASIAQRFARSAFGARAKAPVEVHTVHIGASKDSVTSILNDAEITAEEAAMPGMKGSWRAHLTGWATAAAKGETHEGTAAGQAGQSKKKNDDKKGKKVTQNEGIRQSIGRPKSASWPLTLAHLSLLADIRFGSGVVHSHGGPHSLSRRSTFSSPTKSILKRFPSADSASSAGSVRLIPRQPKVDYASEIQLLFPSPAPLTRKAAPAIALPIFPAGASRSHTLLKLDNEAARACEQVMDEFFVDLVATFGPLEHVHALATDRGSSPCQNEEANSSVESFLDPWVGRPVRRGLRD